MMIDCDACKDDRHDDCIEDLECLCYRYCEVHAEWADAPERSQHPAREPELVTDGGLGSGNWLMGELP